MEDLDVSDIRDETFLPDFGDEISTMSGIGNNSIKRKLNFPEVVKDEDGFDDRLKRAARKSESEGSLTPMVKEELRCFIAAKRHSEGKQDIKVEFKEPEAYPLTPDEICKKERRREQNRRAATKCRKKKKDAKQTKESEMQILRDSNTNLQKEVRTLNRELKVLTDVLQKHEVSGQCCLNTSFLGNIPVHLYDGSYRDEPDTADLIYSPRSPSSFFGSSPNVNCNTNVDDCSGCVPDLQFVGNIRISPEVNDHQVYQPFTLNGTNDLTPPVSPYLTEFPDNVLHHGLDPQLSDILRQVDYFPL